MPIRETSLKAYIDLGPKKIKQGHLLFLALVRARRPVSDREIARFMELDRTSVCGRRNELMKRDLVIHAGFKKCQFTEKTVRTYKVANNEKARALYNRLKIKE